MVTISCYYKEKMEDFKWQDSEVTDLEHFAVKAELEELQDDIHVKTSYSFTI